MKNIAELRMVTCCNCDKIIWDGFCYVISSQYAICIDCLQKELKTEFDKLLKPEER